MDIEKYEFYASWINDPDPLKRAYAKWVIERGYVAPSEVANPIDVPDVEARVRVLAAIRTCPQRGASLPVSLQPECGCAELYECRAGKGKVPGQVTTADCWTCKGGG
jgi:hypothetical protein